MQRTPRRVRNTKNGREYTTRVPVLPDGVEEIDKPALRANGENLPPKNKTRLAPARKAAAKKAAEATPSNGDEPAERKPEEGSE